MKQKVIDYLMSHYKVSPEDAVKAVLAGQLFIEQGIKWNSGVYYVAGEIADKAGFIHPDPCPACQAE